MDDKSKNFSPFTISRVSCALYHSFVIGKRKSFVRLFGWGRNHNNVLCLGSHVAETPFPTTIPHFGKSNVFQVSCGLNHTAVLIKYPKRTGGKVYTCGLGNRGRLGYTKTNKEAETAETDSWFSPKPSRVMFPNKEKISRVSCGTDHSLAISDRGEMFAWGVGKYGCLGTGKLEDVYQPVNIPLENGKAFVIHCSAGGKHSLACTTEGHMYSWGHAGNGRLGLGHLRTVLVPTLIDSSLDREFIFVSAGEAHSASIDKTGVLYTWGAGSYGRLGHGSDQDVEVPRRVEEFGGIAMIQVACATFHTMAIARSGALYGWGSSLALGLLPEGDNKPVLIPKKVREGGLPETVCQVAVGTYHTIALTRTGDVFCWGVGGQSRLGHGDDVNQPFPKQIAELRNRVYLEDIGQWYISDAEYKKLYRSNSLHVAVQKIQSVSCGQAHTMILLDKGEIWVWGSNSHGQLGLGTSEDQTAVYEPVLLNAFKDSIRRIACGQKHSVASNIRGEIYVWGSGDDGQLGLGRITDSYVPTGLTSMAGVFDVFAGEDFTACLVSPHSTNTPAAGARSGGIHAEAGDLWTWGSCEAGKLGHDGMFSGSCLSPKKVKFSVPISMVACGRNHMVACSANGQVFAWGAGYYGRLGIGSSANSSVPVLVPFPEEVFVSSVYTGAYHSIALTSSGFLYVWGRDISLCSSEHLMLPTLFEKLESAEGRVKCKAVATHAEHTLAVTFSGQVWVWGDNKDFQLGCDNKTSNFISKPELLLSLTDSVELIATGQYHTLAILRNNDAVTWGHNISGCLGIGSKKRKFCVQPERVIYHWTTSTHGASSLSDTQIPPVSLTNGISMTLPKGMSGFLQQGGMNVHASLINDPNEERIKQFLSLLRFQRDSSMLSRLQTLLKAEPDACRLQELYAREDDLVKILGHHLTVILKMKEKEQELRYLESCVKTKVVCSALIGQEICGFFTQKLPLIQKVINWLFLQPVYCVYLASSVHLDHERELLYKVLKQMYWNPQDRHANAVFLSLCGAVCTKEVEKAPDLLRLFRPETSNFIHLMSIYAVHTACNDDFGHFFVDPEHEGGLAQVLDRLHSTCLVLDSEKLVEFVPECRGDNDKIQVLFNRSIDGLNAVIGTINGRVTFPVGLASLIQHAYNAIVDRDFPFDAFEGKGAHQQLSLYYPLVRVFLQGILCRFFKEPLVYAKMMCAAPYQSPFIEINFRTLWIFFNSAFETNLAEYKSSHLFREVFQMGYCKSVELLIPVILYTVPEYVRAEDDVDREQQKRVSLYSPTHKKALVSSDSLMFVLVYKLWQNTVSLFTMHFDTSEYVVMLRNDILAAFLNLFKQHEAYLQLSVYDPVSEALKQIAEGKNILFDTDMMAILEQHPQYHNIRIKRHFIVTERNIVFDGLTGVPVPQRLALRQQASTRHGAAVIALINRYVAPDSSDPRAILEEALRLSPPISAKTWGALSEQLSVLQDFFIRQATPDFEAAQVLRKAAQHAENFQYQDVPVTEMCKWIAEKMKQRQRHLIYLSIIHQNEELIEEAQRKYRLESQEKIAQLTHLAELIGQFFIEPEIREKIHEKRVRPQLDNLREALSLENYSIEDDSPTVTVFLHDLMHHSVVVTCSLVPHPKARHSLTFTYHKENGWNIDLLQSFPTGNHVLDHFTISNDEINYLNDLPPFTTTSYGNG